MRFICGACEIPSHRFLARFTAPGICSLHLVFKNVRDGDQARTPALLGQMLTGHLPSLELNFFPSFKRKVSGIVLYPVVYSQGLIKYTQRIPPGCRGVNFLASSLRHQRTFTKSFLFATGWVCAETNSSTHPDVF